MSFEQPKDQREIIVEKISRLNDEELDRLIEDPLDVMSTTKEGEENPWLSVSDEEIKTLGQAEKERRGN